MILSSVIITLSITAVLATIASLFKHDVWWIRIFDFPRVQISVFTSFMFAALLSVFEKNIFWHYVLGISLLGCIGYQLKKIFPYTRLAKKQVLNTPRSKETSTISILAANVLTPNRRVSDLLKIIKANSPDIVLTVETDKWWEQQLDVLEDEMPHTLKCPLDNLYGMHLYSRLPLSDSAIEYLVKDDIPSMHACVTLRSGVEVRMHFMHPEPPSPTESELSSPRDAELAVLARSVAGSDEPIIVTGDLNDVAWSPTTRLFRHISGLLDPRIGRGAFNTFHADFPFLRWPLDHVFHSDHFTLSQIERLPHIGSDHFSLYTALNYTPQKGKEQEGESADQEDRERAEEAVTEEDVEKQDVPNPMS